MHILVDTNIYLDLILDRGQFTETSSLFFQNAILSKSKLFLSPMTIRDVGYTVGRAFHSQEKAREAQIKVYEMCHKVINYTNDDAINALYSDVKDYEDAVLVEAAKRELIDCIVTNNISDFKDSKFPVLTPDEFNKIFKDINNNL